MFKLNKFECVVMDDILSVICLILVLVLLTIQASVITDNTNKINELQQQIKDLNSSMYIKSNLDKYSFEK